MTASLAQANNFSEQPQEWWLLWEKVYHPVESVYRRFPGIENACTVGDVVDYTTNEVFSRRSILTGFGLLHYARRVAHNFCLRIKKLQNRGEVASSEYHSQFQAEASSPDASPLWWEKVTPEQCLAAVKKVCNVDEETILYLYYYNGKNYVEIAGILKMKENTVRSHARRARRRLKQFLTDNHRGNESHLV